MGWVGGCWGSSEVPFLASHVPVRPFHSHWLNKEAYKWCQHGEREIKRGGEAKEL